MSQPVSWPTGGGKPLGLGDLKKMQDLLPLPGRFDCKTFPGNHE
jgi:hypothetical protein